MSEVFISYSKADKAIAHALADDLKEAGYDVWWDFELYAGDDYHNAILEALDASRNAIVIWSDTAVRSAWVRDEAKRAAEDNKLITTHVPGFNLRNIPLGMGQRQCVEVTDREQIFKALDRQRAAQREAHAELATRIRTNEQGDAYSRVYYDEPASEGGLTAEQLIGKYAGSQFKRSSSDLGGALQYLRPFLPAAGVAGIPDDSTATTLVKPLVTLIESRNYTIPVVGRIVTLAQALLRGPATKPPAGKQPKEFEDHYDEREKVARYLTRIASSALISLRPYY